MPRGFHPVLLILAFLPASAGALGLGDIHVDSALNEPLSAQIEIVGASFEDLTDLRASVATLEIFQRYAAERPTYLNSAAFKVGRDAQGRPVLNVRSRDSFTDPLVSFLVDLRWRNNELVREYSLLLDPAGLSASRRAAASSAASTVAATAVNEPMQVKDQPPAVIPATPALTAPVSRSMTPAHLAATGSLHRITSRDTLRAIVRHAGARSETEVQRMMIATFRANPSAFEGNINRLHRGVVLNLPTAAESDAIAPAEARHDVAEQMTAWRNGSRYAARPAVAAVVPTLPAAPSAPVARTAEPAQPDAALTNRLHSLEQQLVDLHQQIAMESANIQELKQAAAQPAPARPSSSVAPAPPDRTPAPMNSNTLLAFGALVLGAALALYGYLRRRLQRPAPSDEMLIAANMPVAPIGEGLEPVKPAAAESPLGATVEPPLRPAMPVVSPLWPPLAAADAAPGVAIEVDTEALERSYLESLGFNPPAIGEKVMSTGEFNFAENPADSATATLESPVPIVKAVSTVTSEFDLSDIYDDIDAAEVNTAVIEVDATTKMAPAATSAPVPVSVPVSDQITSITTELDFNLSDLDSTAQHVQMPSALNDRVEVSERRTNIVDVLKMAIDRDPHRRDLRMKLVETYYNAAAGNRQAFLDVVRKLAREREFLSAEEWSKVVRMGRDLAPDDILFTDLVKDQDDVAA